MIFDHKLFVRTGVFLILGLSLTVMMAVYGLAGSLDRGERVLWVAIMLIASVSAYGMIMHHWQLGILCLLAYMPFSGLPGILLYSSIGTGWASLFKDVLFVIPAYMSFVGWAMRNRGVAHPRGTTQILMLLLAGLVTLNLFNSELLSPLVGLIGLKVWLFYIPLYFLGYHLVDSKEQLIRLARVMLAIGMIPVIYGIGQAIALYSGFAELAYGLHGLAAEDATQFYTTFSEAGGQGLSRLPSLFTFVTQYITFLVGLLPFSYALWMGADPRRGPRVWYLISLGLIVLAGPLSGARAAYVLFPAYFGLALCLDGRWTNWWKPTLAITCMIPAGLGALVWLLGSMPNTFLDFVVDITGGYLSIGREESVIHQFTDALSVTWIGMGTGIATGPARYASAVLEGIPATEANISGVEAFYAKTIVELGVPGLIVVVLLLGWLLIAGYLRLREVKDEPLRVIGVALLSFLGLVVLYLFKGSFLDIDPLNVYFWLFAGVLMKLPQLQANSALGGPILARS